MAYDDHLHIRDRLAAAAKQKQEPKDRLWAAIFVLVILVLVVGVVTTTYAETTRNYLEAGRELGYQRGAVDCLQVIVDGDRNFGLPTYCTKPQVAVYFPPEVCDVYFADTPVCATKWGDG